MAVKVSFIEKNIIKLKNPLAIAVQKQTIKAKTEKRMKGPNFCLSILKKGCLFGSLTSHIMFIESRKTENVPIAPIIEKPPTKKVVQAELNGDSAFTNN